MHRILSLILVIAAVHAASLPDHATVTKHLQAIVGQDNGGFGFPMWACIVDRSGTVQVLTRSGATPGDQWPGSRAIAAQKANTANAFSLPGLALSTANIYSAVQPGGSLYGLQHSNPVDPSVVYAGAMDDFGTADDPLVGERPGGVNVFGGGLPLYASDGTLLGALGLSGDSSVCDHVIAWKLRDALDLDYLPGGVSGTGDDNMVIDINDGVSASGWGHPATTAEATAIVGKLPASHPVGKTH